MFSFLPDNNTACEYNTAAVHTKAAFNRTEAAVGTDETIVYTFLSGSNQNQITSLKINHKKLLFVLHQILSNALW